MSTITKQRPEANESSEYFKRYIQQVESNDFLQTLKTAKSNTIDFFKKLTEAQWNHRYAPGKWSVKEAMIHMIDTERIFCYRALRISRNDKTPLPGFEQDDYISYCNADNRTATSIIEEYEAVRNATIQLYQYLDDEALVRIGTASDSPNSPRAIGFIIAGHEIHHFKILKEKYLS